MAVLANQPAMLTTAIYTSDILTYIAEFSLRPQQTFQTSDCIAMHTFLVFYPALPITLASRDENLLGIRCHCPTEALLALDVEPSRHFSILTCWRWAGLDDREGSRWVTCVGDLDLRAFERVRSFDRVGSRDGVQAHALPAVPEYEHDVLKLLYLISWVDGRLMNYACCSSNVEGVA